MKTKNLLKKAFLLLALIGGASNAWGDPTYTDQASTVTWAFTSHTDLSSTNSPADAFLTTNFSAGSNLNLSSVTRKATNWTQSYNMVAFVPTATVAKNTGETAANTLTFTITPAVGITFTPTNVSLTGCNYGGTGDPKTNIYVVYADDSKENLVSNLGMIRDDKKSTDTQGGTSPSLLSYNLGHAVAGKLVVKIWMDGLTNTAKGVAFTNIVVTGTVSGTPVATTTYTITANVNDGSLGSAAGSATVAENEEVTLTATPTAAGSFVKWQKDGDDFSGNTANPLTVTATANATYTAIFEAKKAITFDKGAGTGTAPSTVYVISGADYTIPECYFLYKSGATLTGWSDGVNTYAPGATISNVTTDIDLTAVFTDNAVAFGDEGTTVNWTFDRSSGAPSIACENSELDYVQHTTISGTRFDAVMHVNTLKNAVIDGSTGKLNNTARASDAQVNKGTKFTIPVIKGSIITFNGTNGTAAVGDVTFGGNNGTVSGAVTTYTYSGDTGTLDIIDTKGGFYPSGISVVYPPTSVSKEVSTAGWATYCSPYALDFTGDITNLTDAYIVTGATGSTLNLTSVKGNKVAANTGILIEGSEGTVTIPVAASGTDYSATNKLVGVTTETSGVAAGIYVLMGTPKVGFYETTNAFTVGANTAYLPANFAGVAARSAYFFGGNITAVDNVEAVAEAKAKEGKFIENGKLVIVKNGQKFNAAGAKLY